MHVRPPVSRREFLCRSGGGFGAVALSWLLSRDLGPLARAEDVVIDPLNPLAKRQPHFKARAKSVIFLFMEGGPSHIDLFDPKPTLEKLAGQPMPESFGRPITAMGTANNALMPTKRKFKQHGESGIWVSDWYPNVAEHVDDIAMVRSCWADGLNHVGSVCQMNTGDILAGRPAMGAWATYGLGAANENLPAFVVMTDGNEPLGGPKQYTSGFLPASFQGTLLNAGKVPIFDLGNPKTIGDKQQRSKLDLLTEMNRRYAADKPDDTELAARLNSYELAFRMQAAAPEAVDLSSESEETKKLYGIDEEATRKYGTVCLMGRRLVERGVRFVELYSGAGSAWDAHVDIEENHTRMCRSSDKPIAGLLKDLKARGLLDSTLVVWGGEFGRTPFSEKTLGRDHNPWGFTMWFAGAGVKGGTVIGETDDLGLRAIKDKQHVHDIHATMLYAMGLDNERLTYLHNGREERPTINDGEPLKDIFA